MFIPSRRLLREISIERLAANECSYHPQAEAGQFKLGQRGNLGSARLLTLRVTLAGRTREPRDEQDSTRGHGMLKRIRSEQATVGTWSPKSVHPILYAGATYAGAVSATFDTTSSLTLYTVDLGSAEKDLAPIGSLASEAKYACRGAWGGGWRGKGRDEREIETATSFFGRRRCGWKGRESGTDGSGCVCVCAGAGSASWRGRMWGVRASWG